ncbi:MAG: hypothetical protein ACLP9L_21750 [Thermoguttaceae bacterium]
MKAGLCSFAVLFFATVAPAEDMKTVTISKVGTAVMTIRAPQSAKVTMDKEKTVIDTKDMVLDLWVVPKAKTVAAAIASLDDVIKGEVLKFSPTSKEAITVAGAEGKHLMGKGIEADDQDPATVDVVVFKVGRTVLVACVHGEGEAAVRQRQPMLNALKTVKAP